jgi:site-specific DNA recombinase
MDNEMGSFRKKNLYENRVGLIYARVSGRKQRTEGHGLESQEQRCLTKLEEENILYERSFFDSFTGGGDFMNRPAMREMLEFIDENPHKSFVVIFDDLKRFARDTEFHLKLRSAFKIRDVIPKCLNYDFDDSPEGIYVETIQAAHNQLERQQNQRQVIQKQQARLRNGYWAFCAPLGYKKIKDPIHGTIDIPTKDSEFIKEALEGFANRRFPNKIDAVRYLQEKGIISNNQHPNKGIVTFTNLLKNPFYAGFIEFPKWEVERRKGHHKEIIDIETFEKNQRVLEGNTSPFVRKDIREDFFLRGLVNCSCCGKKLTGASSRSKTGKLHPYYKCANKECDMYGKSIRAKDIHSEFDTLLGQLRASEDLINLSLAIFEDAWKTEIENLKKEREEKNKTQEKIEFEIERYTSLAVRTTNPTVLKQYEKQIQKLGEEIEILEKNLEIGNDYSIPYRTSSKEVLSVLKNPYSVWKNYDVYQKQKFFYFIFNQNLEYDKKEGYRTPNYTLPIKIFETIENNEPNVVETVGFEPTSKS